MSQIKVIALDIYGTVLASDDPENIMPPRIGLEELFDKCDRKGIKVVSASDSDIAVLRIDLVESGVDITRFDNFYCLNQWPFKDFKWIINDYRIKPSELLVVGDSDKDTLGAEEVKARHIRVARYQGGRDSFDLSSVI